MSIKRRVSILAFCGLTTVFIGSSFALSVPQVSLKQPSCMVITPQRYYDIVMIINAHREKNDMQATLAKEVSPKEAHAFLAEYEIAKVNARNPGKIKGECKNKKKQEELREFREKAASGVRHVSDVELDEVAAIIAEVYPVYSSGSESKTQSNSAAETVE
jgi:hypothetical protein